MSKFQRNRFKIGGLVIIVGLMVCGNVFAAKYWVAYCNSNQHKSFGGFKHSSSKSCKSSVKTHVDSHHNGKTGVTGCLSGGT
jgi:hypothetical protein